MVHSPTIYCGLTVELFYRATLVIMLFRPVIWATTYNSPWTVLRLALDLCTGERSKIHENLSGMNRVICQLTGREPEFLREGPMGRHSLLQPIREAVRNIVSCRTLNS